MGRGHQERFITALYGGVLFRVGSYMRLSVLNARSFDDASLEL